MSKTEYVCEVVTEHELAGDVHHYERRERVTRCSGCIYATEGYDGGLWCGGFDCSTEPDGFCAWAIPKVEPW